MNVLESALSAYWDKKVLDEEGNYQTFPSGDIAWDTDYESWSAYYTISANKVTILGTPIGYGLSCGETEIELS